jgi:hypothetical protein
MIIHEGCSRFTPEVVDIPLTMASMAYAATQPPLQINIMALCPLRSI